MTAARWDEAREAASLRGQVDPLNIEPFDDLRGETLRAQRVRIDNVDLTAEGDVLRTAVFDTLTQWPAPERLPRDFNPIQVLADGKDPGLGLRGLHASGITGKGVSVAIIGEPLRSTHEEFRGRLVFHTRTGRARGTERATRDSQATMRGTAIAGILAGATVGVAPESQLHYWVDDSSGLDYQPKIDALAEISAFNKDHPPNERIRVVSVSTAFHQEMARLSEWKDALRSAAEAGIIVVHGGLELFGVGCVPRGDRDNPKDYRLAYLAQNGRKMTPGYLYVPIDNLTTASNEGDNVYTFWSQGGLIFAPPYLAGLIALALQIDPALSEKDVWTLLRESGHAFEGGAIVNPEGFLARVRGRLERKTSIVR